MGQIKNIKLHIVTDIKVYIKVHSTVVTFFLILLGFSLTIASLDGKPTCLDEQSPCKCEAKLKVVVTKYRHAHEYMEYICSEDQDAAMLRKLKKSGLNMECKQLKTTKVLTYCKEDRKSTDGIVVAKSGCELRYRICKDYLNVKHLIRIFTFL